MGSGLLVFIVDVMRWMVLIWIILSWARVRSGHPLGRLQIRLDRFMIPVMAPIRRHLPPLRMGGTYLDLAPLVVLIGLGILRRIVA